VLATYKLHAFIVQGVLSDAAVYVTDRILRESGARFTDDGLLSLHDTADLSPDPEPIPDPELALDKLSRWPTLGALEYELFEYLHIAEYLTVSESSKVTCIRLFVPTELFDSAPDLCKERYRLIASRLHEAHKADRTIMQWEPRTGHLFWDEELTRLSKGVFLGDYNIDLRRQVASSRDEQQ